MALRIRLDIDTDMTAEQIADRLRAYAEVANDADDGEAEELFGALADSFVDGEVSE